jgi:Putative DNA-binding domain
VLEAAYPVVTRLLHQRFFAYAADQYIRAHPPAGPCLVEYGASLPEFLEAFPPCQHLLYLPDVARLDWALHRAQHAEDAAAIHPALLRDLGIDEVVRVTFRLHPAVWLLASRCRSTRSGVPISQTPIPTSPSISPREASGSRCDGTATTWYSALWTRRAMPFAYLATYKRTARFTREAAQVTMPEEMKARLRGTLLRALSSEIGAKPEPGVRPPASNPRP